MCITNKPFLKRLKKENTDRVPIWFMRQAGRYLPEYMEIREKTDNFISFCLNPILAAKVTLLPLKRFDLDAAILFADILLVPLALGQNVQFIKGKGPKLNPLKTGEQVNALQWDVSKIAPVFETIRLVRDELDQDKALIGFAGSPWTVACYMIDGQGGNFPKSQNWIKNHSDWLEALIRALEKATIDYLFKQIEAGAEAIQLFDSHAGLLETKDFEQFVTQPTWRIRAALKETYPEIPVIGFPRGASVSNYKNYAKNTGIDCLSLDQNLTPKEAQSLQECGVCLQGNLDPKLLLEGGQPMKEAAQAIIERLGPHHIFNLGHGIIKETPPEHVLDLIDAVRSLRGQS